MMKKKFTGAAALGLCLALGISMGASADSRKVVTLGADLTDQQKQLFWCDLRSGGYPDDH